jgi:hypothetical protein
VPTKFKEDWTKAKATFQQATGAKKPSATFLGVFNKGTGIGSALESCDKAKTVGDLYNAMKTFKTTYEGYLTTLDKAISDPKVTPSADKPAYAKAVTKLKSDLEAIYKSAAETAQALVGQQKKAAVDAAALKSQADQKIADERRKAEQAAAEQKDKKEARKKQLVGFANQLTSCGAQIKLANFLGEIAIELKRAETALTKAAEKDAPLTDVTNAASAVKQLIDKGNTLKTDHEQKDFQAKSVPAAKKTAGEAVMKAKLALMDVANK